jgi:hypothetical protein
VRRSRSHVSFVCVLTITWQLLFALQGVIGLCCQQHEIDPRTPSQADGAQCRLHGSSASAMEGMNTTHDGMQTDGAMQLCDCATIQCAGDGDVAVSGPAAILPPDVAVQPFIEAGEHQSGDSPAAIRLSARPHFRPPRA